jgi:hypothetical protein
MHRQQVKAIARQEEVDAGGELTNERLAHEEYLEDDHRYHRGGARGTSSSDLTKMDAMFGRVN